MVDSPIVRKAVFPLGGAGLRMRPITRVVPKEYLPIGTKALIHFAIQEAVDSGIEEIHFLARRGWRKHYFDSERGGDPDLCDTHGLEPIEELSTRTKFLFHFVNPRVGGFGGAVLSAKPIVRQEPFALILFDDFIDAKHPCLKELIGAHARLRATVFSLTAIHPSEVREFGIVRYDALGSRLYRILGAQEKKPFRRLPSPVMGIVGRYVLTPDVFSILETFARELHPGPIELTPALDVLAKQQQAYGLEVQGHYIHAGTELGYLRTVMYYGLRRSRHAPLLQEEAKALINK